MSSTGGAVPASKLRQYSRVAGNSSAAVLDRAAAPLAPE
jgi:hypothetical protein